MVLNTLYLFLILLMAVLLSVWLGNSFLTSKTEEPLVSYAYNIEAGDTINETASKIYDNIFYKTINGNMLEIDSPTYTGNTDATGDSIKGGWLAKRQDAGSKIIYCTKKVITDGDETELDKVVDSYQAFVYNSKSKNTDSYVVLYMPWKDLTFIHVIDLSSNKHKVSELYYANGDTTSTIVYPNGASFYPSSPISSASKKAVGDTDANNNNFFTLTNYDASFSIFQITSNFFFDNRNGQVVLLDRKNNQLTVYGRDSSILSSPYNNNRVITKTDFSTWNAYDPNGVKTLLYMSIGTNTLIAIIEPDGNDSFRLFSVNRFSGPKLDNNSSSSVYSIGTSATPESMLSDYYKWFYYWTMKGVQDPSKHNYNYSDDYFLKTQLVPNVNTGTFFVNGVKVGKGGTIGPNGVSIVGGIPVSNSNYINGIPGYHIQKPNQYNNNDFLDFMQSSGSGFSNFAQNSGSGIADEINTIGSGLSDFTQSSGRGIKNELNTIGRGVRDEFNYVGRGVANQANKTASGTVDVGEDIAGGIYSGAGNITDQVNKTASGTVNLGKDIVGGTVGLGKDIVGGTVDLGKDIVGGTVDLGKDAWKEIKSLGSSAASSDKKTDSQNNGDPLRAGYENANVSGNKNASSSSNYDKYSYFGAVPNKGNNFIPITSDFSKFGR